MSRARGPVEFWLCLAVAFVFRCLSWPALGTGTTTQLVSADCYGHLQRIGAAVREFPRVASFDVFLGAPDGGVWIWPPGFDFVLAALARLLLGSQASLDDLARLLAWAPPLLGVLAVVQMRRWASRLAEDSSGAGPDASRATAAARVAGWFLALVPAAVTWSMFGHLDQHVAEVLCFVGLGASLQAAVTRQDGDRRAEVEIALWLAAAALVWQGAIFLGPLVAAIAWLAERPRTAGWALAVAALALVPFALRVDGPFTYVSFSLFQPLFLACCALVAAAARWRLLGRGGLLVAGVGIAAVSCLEPLRDAIAMFAHPASVSAGARMEAGGYLSYPSEWISLIAEYRPLHTLGARTLLERLSLALFVLPVALVFWATEVWRGRRAAGPGSDAAVQRAIVPLMLCAAVSAMALAQQRYVYYLAPALALAVVAVWLRWRPALAERSPLLPAALLGALFFSCLAGDLRLLSTGAAAPADLVQTLQALREFDPPARDPLMRSEWLAGEADSVLAPWSFGHLVTAVAGRPAVADNFGYGFFDQARFWTTAPGDDEALRQWMTARRVRYVLVGNLAPVLPAYAAAVGRVDRPDVLARRLFDSVEPRPVAFLEEVVASRTGTVLPDGRFRPQFRVLRLRDPS